MRGVPLAGEALRFGESVRRQQGGNSVFSLKQLKDTTLLLTQIVIP